MSYNHNGKSGVNKARETYDRLVSRFIEQLSNGTAPWVKPWKTTGLDCRMPVNAITKRAYRGVNVFILWATAQTFGYSSNAWLTYRQAAKLGGRVRKGECSTTVVLYKPLTKTDYSKPEDDPDRERTMMLMRGFALFNVAQCDGLPERFTTVEPGEPVDPPEPVEDGAARFFAAIGADVRHGGERAFYNIAGDFIQMPPADTFIDRGAYLATLAHEHVHLSGHKSRCNRQFGVRFGDQRYVLEELVVELGAAFLAAELGIVGKLQHAEYLATWVKLLGDHRQALWTAASKATEAVEYLKARAGLTSEDSDDDEGDEEPLPLAA